MSEKHEEQVGQGNHGSLALSTNARINNNVIGNIGKLAEKANGRRRARTIGREEVESFVALLRKHRRDENVHTIRVYSEEGFVPNSYKYRADITALEATREEDGGWTVKALVVRAKRPRGSGPLATVNNRAA
jgi:hypothetical protein